MNLDLKQKKEAPLLSRTEVLFTASTDSKTPSRSEVRKAVAKNLGVTEELVMIRSISTKYGSRSAEVKAHVYTAVEAAKKIEGKPVLKKHFSEEKKEQKAEEKQ